MSVIDFLVFLEQAQAVPEESSEASVQWPKNVGGGAPGNVRGTIRGLRDLDLGFLIRARTFRTPLPPMNSRIWVMNLRMDPAKLLQTTLIHFTMFHEKVPSFFILFWRFRFAATCQLSEQG